MVNSHNVTIKGTKDGLLLRLDDTCSFSTLLKDIKETFKTHAHMYDEKHVVHIHLHTGNRYLTEEQVSQIQDVIDPKRNLTIDSVDSNVILKEEADRMKRESEVTVVSKIVRSGQILKVDGDLLLVGDVNPGGKVMAGGNIFILGKLQGTAHAGCYGNEEAVICAGTMTPMQLRIAGFIDRTPDRTEPANESECAYIQNNRLMIDRLLVLRKVRPNLNRFLEGGLSNG